MGKLEEVNNLLRSRRGLKKMPRVRQNLSFFEKLDLKKKGKRDGKNERFEEVDIIVDGVSKTIHNSGVIMEEMAKFVTIRCLIYSGSRFGQTKYTFCELINDLKRRNNELEMSLGHMFDVDTKNYRTATSELRNAQLDQDRKDFHELTISNLESKMYNETKNHYWSIIINLEEEVRLLETFHSIISNHLNRHQERISYYWNHATQHMGALSVVPPSEWDLLALKRETRFGEMEGVLEQRHSEIARYQAKKEKLIPEGIIDRFLTSAV